MIKSDDKNDENVSEITTYNLQMLKNMSQNICN